MSSSFSLASYSVRFREKHKQQLLQINGELIPKIDEFFLGYFTALAGKKVKNTETKKLLTARDVSHSASHIEGIIVTGEYGFEADLIDVEGKKPGYRRKKNQAQMLPFHFSLFLPNGGTLGVLILQRFGLLGVRTILSGDLQKAFEAKYPDIRMDIWPQIPDGALKRILANGEVRSIVLRKHQLPADLADSLNTANIEDGQIDYVIRGKHGKRFTALMDAIRERVNQKTQLPMTDLVKVDGFDHDRLLVGVEMGKQTQLVDLTDINKLRAHIDITKKVVLGEDGHPTLASLSKQSKEVLEGIKDVLKLNL